MDKRISAMISDVTDSRNNDDESDERAIHSGIWGATWYAKVLSQQLQEHQHCTLSKMMTASLLWEPFVTIGGHTDGQTAPRSGITCVFLSTRDGSGGPSEVVPHSKDSDRPPGQLEKGS